MSKKPIRLGGWLDRMLVVGLLCVAVSGAAVITQLGGTRAAALTIPPQDVFAKPYAGTLKSSASTSTPRPSPAVVSARTTPAPTPHPTPPPCPAPTYQKRAGLPSTSPIIVVIKKLGIDAPVEQAGVDRHGNMQVPVNPCDVAWFKTGPAPGAAGDAVLDGHLDWTSGPSVFWNLNKLKRGDEIDVLRAGGTRVRFIVSGLRYIAHTTVDNGLFSSTGPPMLSLYTCAGTWDARAQTYTQRLIVDAALAH
jgi:Sortase domain